jgi:hypothetical protein
MLLLAVVALVRAGTGHAPAGYAPAGYAPAGYAPAGYAAFSWDWLNPAHFASPGVFMAGLR